MTAKHAESIIDGYLKRLDGELSDLPSGRRREVSSQIAEHIAEARAQLGDETDADVLTILDRLGEPDDIAAEARARFDVSPNRPGLVEIVALMLLTAGPVVLSIPPVAWVIAALFVWRSKVWSPRSKYRGVYVPLVAGVAVIVVAALIDGLFSGFMQLFPYVVALPICVLLPIGSAIFLASRLGRRMPALGWVGIVIVCLAVYVPAVSVFVPPKVSAFMSTPIGESPRPGCSGFYGTVQFSPNMPMVARAPINVGICWDGTSVRKTWGPDCYADYGPGVIVNVEQCMVTSSPDGSLLVQVSATERPLTSFAGMVSGGTTWRITPDGQIEGFGPPTG
jgi:hypothetical protein